MIPLEALQALDAIDRKGSFAAAAEELYRVPSAITYTIKKLEEQLDIKLFDRDKQRARLTPTGKIVLEKGRDILFQVQQLEEQAKRAETGWEKRLRIVIDTILPCKPFWPLIHELQQQHPWLDVQILEEALSGSWEALVNKRADLIIGISGDEPTGGQWEKAYLGKMNTQLCCSPNHPAATLPAPVEPEQLKDFTHIVISDSARHLPTRSVSLLGIQQILAVSTLSQKVDALESAVGISHLPEYLAQKSITSGKLVAIETKAASKSTLMGMPFFMYWRKGESGKANEWLREKIIEREVLNQIIGS